MSVFYICTNFNSSLYTRDAVQSLLRACSGVRCVVVDNQSSEEERALLASLERELGIEIIWSSENLGYFGGLNLGIKHVDERYGLGHWLIVGNNDLIFPEDFFEGLRSVMSEENPPMVIAPDIRTLEGDPQNPHVISGISTQRELLYSLYWLAPVVSKILSWCAAALGGIGRRGDELHGDAPIYIAQGHGSCYVLSPAFSQVFVGLWMPTFLFFEEYFLSRQLDSVGELTHYDPRIKVVHKGGSTMARVPEGFLWREGKRSFSEYRRLQPIFGAPRDISIADSLLR